MKSIFTIATAIFLATQILGCKPEQKEFENGWVGNWKLIWIANNNTGDTAHNTTTKEIVTTFSANSKQIAAISGGTSLFGEYDLAKKNGISIFIARGDFGGWPNGPWVDAYLGAINAASSYAISKDGLSLTIHTSANQVMYFQKI